MRSGWLIATVLPRIASMRTIAIRGFSRQALSISDLHRGVPRASTMSQSPGQPVRVVQARLVSPRLASAVKRCCCPAGPPAKQ